MILIVVSCIAAVYAFRWYLIYGMGAEWGTEWGGIIASVLNSVQIQVLNVIYKKIAISVTGEIFMNKKTNSSSAANENR